MNSTRIHMVPWYLLHWRIGYWLVFFVNVTSSDFYIAYLYLNNMTSHPFGFYLYHYRDGSFGWYDGFQGEQSVGNTSSMPRATVIPVLSLEAAFKYPNKLFVVGGGLRILNDKGTFDGNTIYALLNLYNVTQSYGDWNELWVLKTDGRSYYFGILYMYNYDHSTVRYAYELHLNSLSTRYTQYPLTIHASWAYATAPNSDSAPPPPHSALSLAPTSIFFAVGLATLSVVSWRLRRRKW